MGKNLAIAGVTGAVGHEFLEILEERDFPFDNIKMLASNRSAGKKITFKGKEYAVEDLLGLGFQFEHCRQAGSACCLICADYHAFYGVGFMQRPNGNQSDDGRTVWICDDALVCRDGICVYFRYD